MDKVGVASTGPAVGLGRGEDKCNYQGPQAEAEDNADHIEHQRSTRYEEVARRTHSHADIEEESTSSNENCSKSGQHRSLHRKRRQKITWHKSRQIL
jgi:hypothetical protein